MTIFNCNLLYTFQTGNETTMFKSVFFGLYYDRITNCLLKRTMLIPKLQTFLSKIQSLAKIPTENLYESSPRSNCSWIPNKAIKHKLDNITSLLTAGKRIKRTGRYLIVLTPNCWKLRYAKHESKTAWQNLL